MQRHGALPRHLGWLFAIALILCGFAPSMAAKAAPVADPTAGVFYAATTAAYDTWNADTSDNAPQPAHTITFAAGTRTVAFYFEYDGATASSTEIAVVIKNSAGAVYTTSDTQQVDYQSGMEMLEVDAPNGAYASGSYTASLTMDEAQVASTTFSISSPSTSKAKPAATVFYPTTLRSYNSWVADTSPKPRPAKTAMFVSGTATIGFYIEYKNVVAKSTKFQVAVYDNNNKAYAYDSQFTLSYANGSVMVRLVPHSDDAYAGGAYHATLWIDGHAVVRTTFSVDAAG